MVCVLVMCSEKGRGINREAWIRTIVGSLVEVDVSGAWRRLDLVRLGRLLYRLLIQARAWRRTGVSGSGTNTTHVNLADAGLKGDYWPD